MKQEAEDATAAAREERKRRQKKAKEEFMRKHMEQDDKQDINIKWNGSMELLLADIVTPENEASDTQLGKRKSPNSRDVRNVRSKPDADKI